MNKKDLIKINDYLWEIPKSFRSDMRVPGRIYSSEKMLEQILRDKSLEQVVNVATLPGIQKYSLAMPDIHEGYGAPIGGVFAVSVQDGVISPGAIGYDQNCGVRLLRSEKTIDEIQPRLDDLADGLNREIPSGVGKSGRMRLKNPDFDRVLKNGASRLVESGYGEEADLEFLESRGSLGAADPSLVSEHAKNRGRDQLGTMGAGNHFVEVQKVDEIFDKKVADIFGLFKNQVTIMIHTGSRGLGHQIATDYIKIMLKNLPKYGIELPDRQLAALPFHSSEGQNFFKAMSAGANFAWANRQLITWEVRRVWSGILGKSGSSLSVVYDVAHNIAKLEEQENGKTLLVHRKGATRAFPAGHPEIPEKYKEAGQPVLIPGSMGTASYVLAGQKKAMEESFGSTCHGAGRKMSRHEALKMVKGEELKKQLEEKGIAVRGGSWRGLAEEAPLAYKNVDDVVEVVDAAGLAKKVARLKPVGVIKG